MVTAVELVRDRLRRSTAALDAAGVPYAVISGNAVAAWVATVNEEAIRNTRDVDILLRRGDLDAAERALAPAGFTRCKVGGFDMFLDGPNAGPKSAVHVILAGEKVRPADPVETPEVYDVERLAHFAVVPLAALVRMKLTSYCRKDQVHLLHMLDVGLIDPSWTALLPADLAARLQLLIDTPEG